MLTFFLIVVSLWLLLILVATWLDIRQRLNSSPKKSPSKNATKSGLSGLSLIDNFRILTTLEDKQEKQRDMYQLFEWLRGLGHINVLFFHYLGVLLAREHQGELAKENPPFVGFFFGFFIKLTFVGFFTLNGIASGKWFFRMFQTKKSTNKLVLRFFFERFIMFAPVYYLFIVFYLVYVKHWVPQRFYDPVVVDNCNDSLFANLLFVSNFVGVEKIVSN